MSELVIRRADLDDVECVARHRVEMFRDMGNLPDGELAGKLLDASVASLRQALIERTYVGWLACAPSGKVVGGAGVHIKPQLPRISPDGSSIETGPVPLVVNVYTELEWRQRGVARNLMTELMRWSIDEGFDRVILHASVTGRHLYESLGFSSTNEMRWIPSRRSGDEVRADMRGMAGRDTAR